MSELVVWKKGKSREVRREDVWLTDRTRHVTTKRCERERWLGWHEFGSGLDLKWVPDDLVVGKAIHYGLEVLLGGADVWDAVAAAGAMVRQDEELDLSEISFLGPEVEAMLVEEQARLAEALVAAFGLRVVGDLLGQFEVLGIEEEVSWEVSEGLVMMSRPDVVLRRKVDGEVVVVSYKSAKRFDAEDQMGLLTDEQGMAEAVAVRERMGLEYTPSTMYVYLLKGDRSLDKTLGVKRYGSSLIRPWVPKGVLGVDPFQAKMSWSWVDGEGNEKRLSQKWERVNAWEKWDWKEWLMEVEGGGVHPEAGLDWLGGVVMTPQPVSWREDFVERWLRGFQRVEGRVKEWKEVEDTVMTSSSCVRWGGRKCRFWDLCWGGLKVEEGLNGRFKLREANHPQEFNPND